MPKNIKITKEMILNAAFEITKKDGISKVSNRELAKYLNCSIRPIYYQFKNSDELFNSLYNMIHEYFYKFILANLNDKFPKYKQVGLNYIKFAREEKNFYHVLFLNKNCNLDTFNGNNDSNFNKVKDFIKISTNLSNEDINDFHFKMWTFCHGLATLLANDKIYLTDEQIKILISMEFQALMLLKDNPDNKYIFKEVKWKIF